MVAQLFTGGKTKELKTLGKVVTKTPTEFMCVAGCTLVGVGSVHRTDEVLGRGSMKSVGSAPPLPAAGVLPGRLHLCRWPLFVFSG